MTLLNELFKDSGNHIEIREISPGGTAKQHFLTLAEARVYQGPDNKNVYFGVFDRKKGNGKTDGCLSTGALWADFDEEMAGLVVTQRAQKVYAKIRGAGLPEPSIVVSSGNGIHTYWLLSERAADEAVTVAKALTLATGADPRPAHKAAIMRLPGYMNVKNKDKPLPCEIIKADINKRYKLGTFQAALREYIGQAPKNATGAKIAPATENLGVAIDRPCIEAILQGVPAGERNFALGRLTKWLQQRKYTNKQSQKIILQWNKRNQPPEDIKRLLRDFHAYWHGDYKLLGCKINQPEFQQILYKYCNRPECSFYMAIGHLSLDNTVSYNNRLLADINKVTGNDLIIYGLLLRHDEGLTTSLLGEELTQRRTDKPCIGYKTILKSIRTLNKLGFVDIKKGNRRAGRENLYKVIPQGTYGLGYVLVSNGAINGAIDNRVTPGEFRLYVLLLRYAFGKGACYPSLRTLAKELYVTPQAINWLLRGLEAAYYVKREYRLIKGVEKLYNRLLV